MMMMMVFLVFTIKLDELAGRPFCAAGCLAVANFDQLLNTPMRIRIIFISIFMNVLCISVRKVTFFYRIFLIRGHRGEFKE